jgi:methionyl-tRNA synthetase
MSKSLGNVINPADILDQWPVDVVRYYFLRELQSTDDSDFSWKNLENRYQSDLANGLGNLVQRTATLVATKLGGKALYRSELAASVPELASSLDDTAYHTAFSQFRLHDASAAVWEKIGTANAYINANEPWKQEGEAQARTLAVASAMVMHIAQLLLPLMPDTAERIASILGVPLSDWKDGTQTAVVVGEPLFPRRS